LHAPVALCVDLQRNVRLNEPHLIEEVHARCLLWGKERAAAHERVGRFDVVIAADCLFLTQYHADLLESLEMLLEVDGYAVLIGPRRGGSQELFVRRARESARSFEVEIHDHIHPRVHALVQQQLERCVDPEERATLEDKLAPRMIIVRRQSSKPR
jgi:predicted nicotinamide N-methyase